MSDCYLTSHLYFLSTADPHVHLDKCTYFDQARLDQRFEVVDEPIVSVCSKFAASKFHIFIVTMSDMKTELSKLATTVIFTSKSERTKLFSSF